MRMPREPDGPRDVDLRAGHGDAAVPAGGPAVPGSGAAGAGGLRDRRQHLVGQLRGVTYWQRLVQARVDLVVAGLLYGAPAPPNVSWTVPAGTAAAAATEDLQGLISPPDGLDLSLLIGHAAHDGGGPSAHLERLRLTSVLLAGRRRVLEDQLDGVTLALHDRLASDGAEDGVEASGGVKPLVPGTTARVRHDGTQGPSSTTARDPA